MKMRRSIIFIVALALILSVPMTSFGATKERKWIKIDGNISDVSDGLVLVQNEDSKYGYVDKTGKTVVPFVYENLYSFSEGLALFSEYKEDYGFKYGYIDKTGKVVIPCEKDMRMLTDWDTGNFHEGMVATIEMDSDGNVKMGYMDKSGKQVIPCIYKEAHRFSDGLALVSKMEGENQKFGYIDKTGKVVIPFIYNYGYYFSDGLALVNKEEGKDVYIDKTGKEVLACESHCGGSFNDGLASLHKAGKMGFMDKKGKTIVPCVYNYVDDFSEGLASVSKDFKQGVVDKMGKIVVPFNYSRITEFHQGMAIVIKDEKVGLIDKQGNEIIQPIYNALGYYDDTLAVLKGKEWFVGSLKEEAEKEEKEPVKEPMKIKDKKALSTSAKVLVNGKEIAFEAYNIDGNNYFKLRDLAKVVTGTEKQFEITWDQEKKAVNMISNKEYTAVGGELEKKDVKDEKATLSNSVIYKDGEKVDLKAYLIKGNNYFKLRDVAKAFDIGIGWDNETKTITVDTEKSYE